MQIEEMKNDYDWKSAFGYCNCIRNFVGCSNEGFTIEDVEYIFETSEGQNDGESWLAVGKLKGGRFFFLAAWCDYTGWDCQAGGDSNVADTLDNLVRFCIGDRERQRLNMPLADYVA